MSKNIGKKDRFIRFFLSAVFFALIFFVQPLLPKVLFLIFSLFSFLESLFGWCGFYYLIGKNTCSVKTEDKN